jgi:hypothetical protein
MGNRKSAPVKFENKEKVFVDKIIAAYEDVISWEAHDSDIVIFVPEASAVFGSKERIFDIPKGKNIELKVIDKPDTGEQRKYFYAVYHKHARYFAESNSNPVIIIQG